MPHTATLKHRPRRIADGAEPEQLSGFTMSQVGLDMRLAQPQVTPLR